MKRHPTLEYSEALSGLAPFLLKACKAFDESKGFRPSTYIVWALRSGRGEAFRQKHLGVNTQTDKGRLIRGMVSLQAMADEKVRQGFSERQAADSGLWDRQSIDPLEQMVHREQLQVARVVADWVWYWPHYAMSLTARDIDMERMTGMTADRINELKTRVTGLIRAEADVDSDQDGKLDVQIQDLIDNLEIRAVAIARQQEVIDDLVSVIDEVIAEGGPIAGRARAARSRSGALAFRGVTHGEAIEGAGDN